VTRLLVSVVVSTYNRAERLELLLAALRRQTLPSEAFEVVVVDNGSGPETAALLEREASRPGVTVRSVRHEVTRGPAGGRNTGWRLSTAPLVAFTDDDCRPDRRWLEEVVSIAELHPGAIIQGPTKPDPADGPHGGVLARTVSIERLGPQFETCNIVYPRRLLETVAGFDESFGLRPAGEDTDLAWRALEIGTRPVWAADAVVFHAVERVGVRGQLRVAARWGDGMRVYATHPGARSMLFRGVFWNVWHYLMWRSAAASLAPAWLRRMLLARHLLALRKRARAQHAGPWAIPYFVLHDTIECWAIARGAIRARTLVL
jgi:glycosyltransferase involved in cell wall biosynthesis